ncbi:MAG TPA: hypothetical protein VHQ91_04230, partial [Geminicoccaceae bacterium]|nr:hypothetical protein [Geminicoccaceae bacterium]
RGIPLLESHEEDGMPARRELTMRQLRQMLRLAHEGVSARAIGRMLGAARSTVQDTSSGPKPQAWPGRSAPRSPTPIFLVVSRGYLFSQWSTRIRGRDYSCALDGGPAWTWRRCQPALPLEGMLVEIDVIAVVLHDRVPWLVANL